MMATKACMKVTTRCTHLLRIQAQKIKKFVNTNKFYSCEDKLTRQ